MQVNSAVVALGQGPTRQIAPIEYFHPDVLPGGYNGSGIVSRDARAGIPGADQPNTLYWDGALTTQQKQAAIYFSPTPIYTNGPAVGTSGAGTADHSLIGHFLNNIGGSSR